MNFSWQFEYQMFAELCLENSLVYIPYLKNISTVVWGNLDQFSTLTLNNSILNCFLLLEKIAMTSSISII